MLTGNEDKDSTSPLLTMDFTGGYAKYNETSYSPSLPAGYLLHEFEIISVLGTGGFGITYLANDTNLNLQVAIKEYFPPSLAVRDMVTGSVFVKYEKFNSHEADFEWGKTRFAQEAQTLARFHHPNIVRVLRYFETNGTGYMVMVYEKGQSLEELLNSDKTGWAEENILEFFKPLLDGVAHVHQAGFLHRDIKPSNIYVRKKDWSPVLLDFGSARAALTNHTQTLTALVSPGYCPLEQYFDEGTQGAWSDIYSIGGVIYRIVTGATPPLAPSRVKKDSMVPMVFAGYQKYSPAFLRAVDQALCMDEEKRPQSIAEWLPGLEGQAQETEPVTVNDSNIPDAEESAKNPKQIPLSESSAVNPVQVNAKRTFYDILQVSNDADTVAIAKSCLLLKAKYEAVGDSDARNELLFIERAVETLSNSSKRKIYDEHLEALSASSIVQYAHSRQFNDDISSDVMGAASSKIVKIIFAVIVSISAVIGYSVYAEIQKIKALNSQQQYTEAQRVAAENIQQQNAEARRVAAENIQQQNAEARRVAAENSQRQYILQQYIEAQRVAAENTQQQNAEARRAALEKINNSLRKNSIVAENTRNQARILAQAVLDAIRLGQVIPGMTANEVTSSLGNPIRIFDRSGFVEWAYATQSGQTNVVFDQNNIVSRIYQLTR